MMSWIKTGNSSCDSGYGYFTGGGDGASTRAREDFPRLQVRVAGNVKLPIFAEGQAASEAIPSFAPPQPCLAYNFPTLTTPASIPQTSHPIIVKSQNKTTIMTPKIFM
jgi:hypothetical protein